MDFLSSHDHILSTNTQEAIYFGHDLITISSKEKNAKFVFATGP